MHEDLFAEIAELDASLSEGESASVEPSSEPPEGGYKVFLGGLPKASTSESIRAYFEQISWIKGRIIRAWQEHTSLSRFPEPRGFGFVVFELEQDMQTALLMSTHWIDDRCVQAKPAVAKARDGSKVAGSKAEERENTADRKVFVRWLSCNSDNVLGYKDSDDLFATVSPLFEGLLECSILVDRDTEEPRTCGFLAFETPAHAAAAVRSNVLHIPGRSALHLAMAKGSTPRTLPRQRRSPCHRRSNSGPLGRNPFTSYDPCFYADFLCNNMGFVAGGGAMDCMAAANSGMMQMQQYHFHMQLQQQYLQMSWMAMMPQQYYFSCPSNFQWGSYGGDYYVDTGYNNCMMLGYGGADFNGCCGEAFWQYGSSEPSESFEDSCEVSMMSAKSTVCIEMTACDSHSGDSDDCQSEPENNGASAETLDGAGGE